MDLFVCLFVCDTKMSTLSEVGKHVMCAYYVRARNELLRISRARASFEELENKALSTYLVSFNFTTFPYDDYYHIFNETFGRSEFRLFYGFPCYV